MAEKPFLTLGPKQFLSGIAPSAHAETAGIFYKADGITPLYDAGGTASPENGLLEAGTTPTDFTGSVIVDKIMGGVETDYSGVPYLYMIGQNGHFYQKGLGAAAPTDLRSGTPITSPTTAMVVWGPAGGTTKLWYWNNGHIGNWDMSGSYPTGWSDSVYTTTTQNKLSVHKFVGNVYYQGSEAIGALTDTGSGSPTHNASILKFQPHTAVSALGDDGQYLVIAVSLNAAGDNFFLETKMYFWDTFSASWSREWSIRDPYIYHIESIGNTVYAYGQYGLYEGNYASGFKKVLSRLIGTTSLSNFTSFGFGEYRGSVYNNQALIIATDSTIDSFGKLQPDVPVAYIKHFKIPSGIVTFMSTNLDAGRVYVGTDTPKLYAFDFNGATHDSGNTAQTVYFSLPGKVSVKRIDVVFGEPLASGDSFSIGVYRDEDTSATSYGTASFATDGSIRRKSLFKGLTCEGQMSLLFTFISGAVKIKKIEVFGDSMTA